MDPSIIGLAAFVSVAAFAFIAFKVVANAIGACCTQASTVENPDSRSLLQRTTTFLPILLWQCCKIILALILSLAVFYGVMIAGHVIPERLEQVAQKEKCERVVLEWLESQRVGRSGSEYWSRDMTVNPVQLFAVREWEIVDHGFLGTEFTVRIASSTQIGIPIVRLWKINLTDWDSPTPKIWLVEEADYND